mmetsp:Transcript_18640/g.43220  ORF Transcript_18640/g.43220 Transcript_18640/m.43220 type:complete len:157 (-) Transcript_18640:111-581(-)
MFVSSLGTDAKNDKNNRARIVLETEFGKFVGRFSLRLSWQSATNVAETHVCLHCLLSSQPQPVLFVLEAARHTINSWERESVFPPWRDPAWRHQDNNDRPPVAGSTLNVSVHQLDARSSSSQESCLHAVLFVLFVCIAGFVLLFVVFGVRRHRFLL